MTTALIITTVVYAAIGLLFAEAGVHAAEAAWNAEHDEPIKTGVVIALKLLVAIFWPAILAAVIVGVVRDKPVGKR